MAGLRAAYRDLLRAASATFAGDHHVLKAFRCQMRENSVFMESTTDVVAYEKSVKLAREIAQVLRRNVVQAVKVQNSEQTWAIKLTKDTEMSTNETTKDFLLSNPVCPDRSNPAEAPPPHVDRNAVPRYYSKLKKAHKNRSIPVLNESDLVESFVRGSGPGGQSINKTENNVQVLHKPTGLRVSCQETRSLQTNRMLARRLLVDKLDQLQNPGLSKIELKMAQKRERERQRRKKARKRLKQ